MNTLRHWYSHREMFFSSLFGDESVDRVRVRSVKIMNGRGVHTPVYIESKLMSKFENQDLDCYFYNSTAAVVMFLFLLKHGSS